MFCRGMDVQSFIISSVPDMVMLSWKSNKAFSCSVTAIGMGPSPGWGPVRVGAHMGPYGPIYGPIWAHVGPCGPIWVLLDRSWKKRQLYVNFP